jgi:hypothetical protein
MHKIRLIMQNSFHAGVAASGPANLADDKSPSRDSRVGRYHVR